MIEQRKNNRIHVTWRGLIKISDDDVLDIKLVEIASSGMLFSCPVVLKTSQIYLILLNVPNLANPSKEPIKVPCKVKVLHSVLSGNSFRSGANIIEIDHSHRELINSWIAFENKVRKN